MRYLIVLLPLILLSIVASAQTRRMTNFEQGRTFSAQNQIQTSLPLLQEADRQFRVLDYEGAFFTLENAVAQNPYSSEALIMRARFKRVIGMDAEAALDFGLANRLNPYAANLYGYHGNNGLLQILSIQPERSVIDLNTFQKLNYYYEVLDRRAINTMDSEVELQLLEEVIEAIEVENLQQAMVEAKIAIQAFPQSAIAYDLQGIIFSKQGKDRAAISAFSKAVDLEPEFAIAWYNFGQVEQRLGNFDQAKIYFDKAIELQEDLTKAYFGRAMLHQAMGNQESALADYEKIIAMKGALYIEAFVNRGLTKKVLGDYRGALTDLNQVIKEYPRNAELRKNRGNVQMLFGMHRKAIDDYNEAIKLDENYAEAYYNRALAHFILYDKISGCYDLEKSKTLGYHKAEETQSHFCTE